MTMIEAGAVPSPTEMADRLAIAEVLALHCRGVDRADLASLKACYWPDALAYYGAEGQPAHEFAQRLIAAIQGFEQTQHMVTNALYAFEGQKARVESCVLAFHYLGAGPEESAAPDNEMTYIGRYIDAFEKRGDVWKILARHPVMSWTQDQQASHDDTNPALAGLARARRHPEDPIYAWPK